MFCLFVVCRGGRGAGGGGGGGTMEILVELEVTLER